MLLKEKFKGRNIQLVLFHLVAVILVSTFKSTAATVATKPLTLWENDDKILENLIKLVDRIEKLRPNSRIYTLGAESQWIGEAKKKVKAHMPKTNNTFIFGRHIPFSEGFQEERREDMGDYTVVLSKKVLTPEQLSNYEKLLHEIGLNPKEIYDHYKEFKRKTVIIEVTSANRYIVTFSRILFNWARREGMDLKDALKIITVSAEDDEVPPVRILFSKKGRFNLTCENVYANSKLLQALVNANKEEGPESSNIVPEYAAKDWEKPVPAMSRNERVKKILAKLNRFAKIYTVLQKYDKHVAITTAASEKFIPRLTLKSRPTDGSYPVEYDVLSMTSGRNNNFCTELEPYMKNKIEYYYKDADLEERYAGIVNEPLYLLFTHGTTGRHTLNIGILSALEMEWAVRQLQGVTGFEQFVMDKIADKSSDAHKIVKLACDDRAAKKQESAEVKLDRPKSPQPIRNSTSIILRALSIDNKFSEIDFEIPYLPVLPAFLAICNVHLKGRAKRDVSTESNSLYAKFRDNPFYMIFNYNTTKEDALNVYVLKNLWSHYAMVPRTVSFNEYLKGQLENSTSLTAKYLKRACDRRYNVNQDTHHDAEVYEEEGYLHKMFVGIPLNVLNFLGSGARKVERFLGGAFLFDWDESTHYNPPGDN